MCLLQSWQVIDFFKPVGQFAGGERRFAFEAADYGIDTVLFDVSSSAVDISFSISPGSHSS